MTLLHHFQEGGWAMWLILFWLVASTTLIIERVLFLFGAHQDTRVFSAAVLKNILSRDFNRALVVSQQAKSPLGRILYSGLDQMIRARTRWDRLDAMQQGMDQAALRELPLINKNIGYLALFANLAMLCGLFGTIVGLIKAFGAVGGENIDPSQKARILAEGISEAMNCTAFGLLAAIVALIGFSTLNGWAGSIEADIHRETVKIYNTISKIMV